jgi:hypothetical protein
MAIRARALQPRAARPAIAAVAGLAAVLLAVGCGGGSGGDDDEAASAGDGEAQSLGAAVADAASETGSGSASEGDADAAGGSDDSGSASDSSAGGGEGDEAASDLPPPTFPESGPPTTVEGMEPLSVPGAEGDDPLFGQLVVDLEPDGYVDLPTELRQGQEFQVLTTADDGIRSRTTVFAPDGSTVAQWESSGRRGDIEGYYWDDEDVLPADGTYVFRVEHLGGAHNQFLLAFYGES